MCERRGRPVYYEFVCFCFLLPCFYLSMFVNLCLMISQSSSVICMFLVPILTNLVARRKVLVLLTGVPFLAVQQQEVDHLFLVVTAER